MKRYAVHLDEQSVIRITGEDAQTFLAGQFTSDIQRVNNEQGQLSCWCDPKGRVLFLFYILQQDTGFLCVLPQAAAQSFTQRLKMFVLRAKVTIEPCEDYQVYGLSFTEDTPLDNKLEAHLTERHRSKTLTKQISIIRIDDHNRRYLLVGETNALAKEISGIEIANGSAAWHAANIQSAIPSLAIALSGEFLPQNLNLDCLEAVSFTKGCYPGQEVIARLRYRGKVKKRLYSAAANAASTAVGLKVGQALRSTDSDGVNIGNISEVVRDDDQLLAAVVVDVAYAAEHTKVLVSDGNLELSIQPPPYPFVRDG